MIDSKNGLIMANLKLIAVVKVRRLQIFLADDFHDGIFQLFLEGDIFAAGVQVVQQPLASRSAHTFIGSLCGAAELQLGLQVNGSTI